MRRSSVRAVRPVSWTAESGLRARSESMAIISSAASAWTTMTLRLWATTSCISRAMRVRSSATAARDSASRSRSRRSARSRSSAVRRALARKMWPTSQAMAAIGIVLIRLVHAPSVSRPTTTRIATSTSAAPASRERVVLRWKP